MAKDYIDNEFPVSREENFGYPENGEQFAEVLEQTETNRGFAESGWTGSEGANDGEDKREERKASWRKYLRSFARAGIAIAATAAIVVGGAEALDGDSARHFLPVREFLEEHIHQPAVQPQTGYSAQEFVDLWNSKPDAPHKYDREHPIVLKEATCTSAAWVRYICSRCDEHEDTTLGDPLPHTPGEEVTENYIEPTDREPGGYDVVVYCTVCGNEIERTHTVLPATGHVHEPGQEQVTRTEATCSKAGNIHTEVRCTVCGELISSNDEPIAKLEHTEGQPEVTRTEATCTEDGNTHTEIHCTVCGELISSNDELIEATGHVEGQAVQTVTKEATCSAEGVLHTEVHCTVCGELLSQSDEPIAKLAHTEGQPEVTQTDATCTEDGNIHTEIHCTVCGELISSTDEPIEATGHKEGRPEVTRTDATCTEDGNIHTEIHCTVCGALISSTDEPIEATGHKEGRPEVTQTDATCTEDGNIHTEIHCTVCGELLSSTDEPIEATGHSFTPVGGATAMPEVTYCDHGCGTPLLT
ncbi:MAG: hypothetical protein KIG36_02250 [Eubacteriales bacterium]|nr:hypothetical protein [Eubacteriales bacterium]